LFVRTVNLNQLENAEKFRASLKTQRLSQYLVNPAGGPTRVLGEKFFAFPFKLTADTLIAQGPIAFLKSLQIAVAAPNTPPLSDYAKKLSDDFNTCLATGTGNSPSLVPVPAKPTS
jgi:hypothetical protein